MGYIKAGHYKAPITYEIADSGRFLPLMERSAVVDTLARAPNRNLGVSKVRNFGEEDRVWFSTAVFRSSSNSGGFDQGDGGYAWADENSIRFSSGFCYERSAKGGRESFFALSHQIVSIRGIGEKRLPTPFRPWERRGATNAINANERKTAEIPMVFISPGYASISRLTCLPYWANNGRRYVHVGGGISYRAFQGVQANDFDRCRTRADVKLGTPFVLDTRIIPDASNERLFSGEFVANFGSLSFQTEALYLAVDAPAGDISYWGAYAQFSYFLTGEYRPYKKSIAGPTRVVYTGR